MIASKITGLGHYVPEQIITNDDLSKMMDTNDEWIQERTGIKERRWAEVGKDTVANMGAKAARMALDRAGMTAEELDFIIYATMTPDYFFPGVAVLTQRELGLNEIGALDIRQQCSGFPYAISIADQFIKSGMYKNILVIGGEIHAFGLDKTTRGRGVSVIFGDGAGAAILQATTEEGKGVLSTHLHAQGEFAEELIMKEPGNFKPNRIYPEMLDSEDIYPHMNGQAVFKHAVTRFPEVIMEALNKNNLSPSDVDLLVPHQANLRITQFIQKRMGLGNDKVYSNIQRYGNTTAASIPIAFSEAWQEGKVKEGDLICLASFGAGFTWASALIRW